MVEVAGAVLGMISILNEVQGTAHEVFKAQRTRGEGWTDLHEDIDQIKLMRAILKDTGQQFLASNSSASSIQDVLRDCERRLKDLSLLFGGDTADWKARSKNKGTTHALTMQKLYSKNDKQERRRALQSFRESVVLLHQLSSA